MNWSAVAVAGGVALTGAGGYLASQAIGAGTQTPQVTTTINAAVGQTGPAGPAGPPGATGATGPAGPPGGIACPTGFVEGILVINHPGGQTSIFTCIKT